MAEAKNKTKDTTAITADNNDKSSEFVDNKRKFYVLSEIIGVVLFTLVSIMYAWFQSKQFEHYETQISVQQSFELIRSHIKDDTQNNLDQFWTWLAQLRFQLMEKEEDTGYYKVVGSPDYAVTDFLITTRRINEVENASDPNLNQWITNDFAPFYDDYDPLINNSTAFQIGSDGSLVQHSSFIEQLESASSDSTEEQLDSTGSDSLQKCSSTTAEPSPDMSYRELGGFHMSIKLDQPELDFIDQISYLKDESEFLSAGTVSAIAEIMFYNSVTKTFVFIALQMIRKPSGIIKYKFEFQKPIGQKQDESIKSLLGFLKYMQIILAGLYILRELFVYCQLIVQYFMERSLKSRTQNIPSLKSKGLTKKDSGTANKIESFEDHVEKICNLHHDYQGKVNQEEEDKEHQERNKDLIKFYWNEKKSEKISDGPSFKNGLKTVLYEDQRYVMYLISILLIPVWIFYQQYKDVFENYLQLGDKSFEEIINPESCWRQLHPQSEIINKLLECTTIDDNMQLLITIFFTLILFRSIFMSAKIFPSLNLNLSLISRIFDFLATFLLTLGFVLLAWTMCQHIMYGNQQEVFASVLQSFISTMMLALRDFTFLNEMYEQEPNVTLLLFMFFIVVVMFFCGCIFASLVIIIYNEIAVIDLKARPQNNAQEILQIEHWSFSFNRKFSQVYKACGCARIGSCFIRCCKCKQKSDDDLNGLKKKDNKEGFSSFKSSILNSFTAKKDIEKQGKDYQDDSDDKNSKKQKDGSKVDENEYATGDNPSAGGSLGDLAKQKKAPKVAIDGIESDNSSSEESKSQNTDNHDASGTTLYQQPENNAIEKSMVAEIEADQIDANLGMTDSDMGQSELEEGHDHKDLVESTQRKKRKTRNQAKSSYQMTPEETKTLLHGNWNHDFEVYNLDADLTQDSKHTSNKQDAFMIKQREQRCGKVIWRTLLQLVYMFLYLYVVIQRYPVGKQHDSNLDIEEIIWRHKFDHSKDSESSIASLQSHYIEDVWSQDGFMDYLRSMEKKLFIQETLDVTSEVNFEQTTNQLDLYFLWNNNNYIFLQGITYCASFNYKVDGEFVLYTKPIQFQEDFAEYLYDETLMHGFGGYCFALFLDKDLDAQRPNEIFADLLEHLEKENETIFEIELLDYKLIVHEPTTNMVTDIEILYTHKEDGLVTIEFAAYSNEVQIDILGIALTFLFMFFFLFNMYLFASSEHNIYQRYKKWYNHNIKPLSKIEQDQRQKFQPDSFRILAIFFRPTNIAYFIHIALTLYTEGLFILSFLEKTNLVTDMAIYPNVAIKNHLIAQPQDLKQMGQDRQQSQLEIQDKLFLLFEAITRYRRFAIFNLFLITSLPLQSASQSQRFRSFLQALVQTANRSIQLYVIMFLFSVSVLFYALHSFGYESEDFKQFTYTQMTLFKMIVGRLLGTYYLVAVEISPWKAIFFTLPIILMKSIFLTVFLAVVAYEYEHEVLNKDFSSNINILRSVFFCNISLDKRQQNKRAKMIQESEAMDRMGAGQSAGAEDADGDVEDQEGNDQGGNLKLGALVGNDGAKPVNGGLEIYNKMDIKFTIQKKIPEWAMACADEIRQEVANRGRLRLEADKLARKLFLKSEGGPAGGSSNSKVNAKKLEQHQLNSFNLMVARKEYITYIWFGIQFLFMQGELIQKVIESTENEIKTLTTPYYDRDEKNEKLDELTKQEKIKKTASFHNSMYSNQYPEQEINYMYVQNPITNRQERLTRQHLEVETLQEQEEIQREIKGYLIILMDDVEERLQRIRKQWSTLQLQNKQSKILKAMVSKQKLQEYGQ